MFFSEPRTCNNFNLICYFNDLTSTVGSYNQVMFCGRCLTVSPNFEIAKNNMAIALTDLGTKVTHLKFYIMIIMQ